MKKERKLFLKKLIFGVQPFFLLLTASVWSRKPEPPLVQWVFWLSFIQKLFYLWIGVRDIATPQLKDGESQDNRSRLLACATHGDVRKRYWPLFSLTFLPNSVPIQFQLNWVSLILVFLQISCGFDQISCGFDHISCGFDQISCGFSQWKCEPKHEKEFFQAQEIKIKNILVTSWGWGGPHSGLHLLF